MKGGGINLENQSPVDQPNLKSPIDQSPPIQSNSPQELITENVSSLENLQQPANTDNESTNQTISPPEVPEVPKTLETDVKTPETEVPKPLETDVKTPETEVSKSLENSIQPKTDLELSSQGESKTENKESGIFDSLLSMIKDDKKGTPDEDTLQTTTPNKMNEDLQREKENIDEKTNSLPDQTSPENIKYRNLLNRVLIVSMETNKNTERLFEVLEVSDTSDKKEIVNKFLNYKMGDNTTLYDIFVNVFRSYPGDNSYYMKKMIYMNKVW